MVLYTVTETDQYAADGTRICAVLVGGDLVRADLSFTVAQSIVAGMLTPDDRVRTERWRGPALEQSAYQFHEARSRELGREAGVLRAD
jgi:hypothetical protein